MPSAESHRRSWPALVSGDAAYARPLIPLSLAFACGITSHHLWPGHTLYAAVIAFAAAIHLVFRIFPEHPLRWAPLVLFGALGYIALAPWLPSTPTDQHLRFFADGRRHAMAGTIAMTPEPGAGERVRLVMDQLSVQIGSRRRPLTGRLRLTVFGPAPELVVGQQIHFEGPLHPLRNFQNRHGFDYRRHMAYQRIYASSWVRGDRLTIVSAFSAEPPSGVLTSYRSRLRQIIASVSRGETGAILAALIIGDRRGLTPDLRDAFNRCGIGHLLAISGLHIGLIASFIYRLLLFGLNRSRIVLAYGIGRQGAALLTIGFVLIYGCLTGMHPSTQRAVVMVVGVLTGGLLRRDTDTVNFLALAALVLMIWHPPVIFSIGFQLSFSAVLGIIWGLAFTASDRGQARPPPERSWRQRLRLFLGVSVYATLGTLPLVMFHFGQISLIGLAANCVAIPFVGIAVLPLGMLALALAPLSVGPAEWILRLVAWLLDAGLFLVHGAADWNFAALHTIQPSPLEIGLYYVLVMAWLAHRRYPRLKLLVAATSLVLIVDCGWWLRHRFSHEDLRITVLDVGQGSATLIEFPGGQTLLADGGGFPDNGMFDVGARVIAPLLRRQKILTVDYLVLSHPSSDHMNGMHYIAAHFRPKVLVWNGTPPDTASGRAFFNLLRRQAIMLATPEAGALPLAIGDARIAILNPVGVPGDQSPKPMYAGINNNSLVLKVSLAGRSVLLPGDIEKAAESDLAKRWGAALASTILVAPHHGSRSSSSAEFVTAVNPRAVIVSCGGQNAYGFPHPQVLARYQAAGCPIFRTDRNGAVSISITASTIRLVCFDRSILDFGSDPHHPRASPHGVGQATTVGR